MSNPITATANFERVGRASSRERSLTASLWVRYRAAVIRELAGMRWRLHFG
ncbi:hypothetical protein [Burkholderia plantarii]|uniref:hypothetical protein n=1 Tax=Burkholderia plantarii TaxID=41899 RepID=UPI000AEF73FB|nr:hypothetical protein [Burkholderia plantarii]